MPDFYKMDSKVLPPKLQVLSLKLFRDVTSFNAFSCIRQGVTE